MTTTRNRVPLHSSDSDNRRIRRAMRANVAYFAEHRDQIADRLREIDEEWDIERAIEANAAVIAFAGIALAARTAGAGNVIVQEVAGKTEVAAVDPVASMQAIQNESLRAIAEEVRGELKAAVEAI